MTAPPCPTPEELARDPNLCAVCGHWCGKACERAEGPRFEVFMASHVVIAPGSRFTPFVTWLRGKVIDWQRENNDFNSPLDHAAFDAWLAKQVEGAPAPKG